MTRSVVEWESCSTGIADVLLCTSALILTYLNDVGVLSFLRFHNVLCKTSSFHLSYLHLIIDCF